MCELAEIITIHEGVTVFTVLSENIFSIYFNDTCTHCGDRSDERFEIVSRSAAAVHLPSRYSRGSIIILYTRA